MKTTLKGSASRIAIYKEIEAVVVHRPDGYVQYPEGVDDQTIADKMPFPCTKWIVGSIRRENFGKFFEPRRQPRGDDDLSLELLAALEGRVEALERTVAGLVGAARRSLL